jgi:hypothetical protein
MSNSTLLDFALSKWQADPSIRIDDAYKWLFQATRGGEHLVDSQEKAAEMLEREWESLGDARDPEPLWETLSPEDSVGRLNLRPFKRCGGKIVDLVEAFLTSSKDYASEPDEFLNVWIELGELLRIRPSANFSYSDWSTLNNATKPRGYPAIHHSDLYRNTRKPAYRIISGYHARQVLHGSPESLQL